uniref:Secreted protein n=1 Tax=Pipistrellus kuhlii TaxID=59472 RepID=A0A7J7UTK6_PIPKU|nr:hypothetical protein mPipKuh1_008740 [Pipistrellus kuhlii]
MFFPLGFLLVFLPAQTCSSGIHSPLLGTCRIRRCSGEARCRHCTTSQLHLLSWMSVPILPVTLESPKRSRIFLALACSFSPSMPAYSEKGIDRRSIRGTFIFLTASSHRFLLKLHTPAHSHGPLETIGVLLAWFHQILESYQHRHTPLVLPSNDIVLQDLGGNRGTEHQDPRSSYSEISSRPLLLPTMT